MGVTAFGESGAPNSGSRLGIVTTGRNSNRYVVLRVCMAEALVSRRKPGIDDVNEVIREYQVVLRLFLNRHRIRVNLSLRTEPQRHHKNPVLHARLLLDDGSGAYYSLRNS